MHSKPREAQLAQGLARSQRVLRRRQLSQAFLTDGVGAGTWGSGTGSGTGSGAEAGTGAAAAAAVGGDVEEDGDGDVYGDGDGGAGEAAIHSSVGTFFSSTHHFISYRHVG